VSDQRVQNPLILALDSTSKPGLVGLGYEKEMIASEKVEAGRTFSEKLLPVVDRVLASGKVTVEDVGLFAVVRGPGSFTGLRIGLATVKGLVYTLNKPVVGLISLEVLAWSAEPEGEQEPVGVCLPARPGWVYAALYKKMERELKTVIKPSLLKIEEWVGYLDKDVWMVGEAALKNRQMAEEIVPGLQISPEPEHHRMKPEALVQWAALEYRRKGAESPDKLGPFYLQPSIAEVRWNEKMDIEKNK
jgi:tRNA threonylcarbamoyladenosine biosynthesis protein TsaB